jgi:hypothetical protein
MKHMKKIGVTGYVNREERSHTDNFSIRGTVGYGRTKILRMW